MTRAEIAAIVARARRDAAGVPDAVAELWTVPQAGRERLLWRLAVTAPAQLLDAIAAETGRP